MSETTPDFLSNSAVEVAKNLIGWRLYTEQADGSLVGGTIIETEAYTEDDAASHSYHGRTPRTEVMFGPAGRIYVYFTYGMHWCMNIVAGEDDRGEAVLIRAIETDSGLETVRQRRSHRPDAELTNGPAKLCQALAVTGEDNGAILNQGRFKLKPPTTQRTVKSTPRIGISSNTDVLWRFVAT